MAKTEYLCSSRNGKRIIYDHILSHAATHFADTPSLKALAIEVLKNKDIDNDNVEFDYDLGRTIGTSDVVDVDETDAIVYAERKNRHEQGLVPFTKSRLAQSSTHVSISLVPKDDESYELSSAWIGRWDDPPFPCEPHATPDSKDYWDKHAFVWGSQQILPGTETSKKPW